MTVHDTVHRVTQRVIANSRASRAAYLALMEREGEDAPDRSLVSCSNLAHAFAGALEDQAALKAHQHCYQLQRYAERASALWSLS